MRRIAAISTSRADYGHLFWILKELEAAADVDLRVIATAAHLAPRFGSTVDRFADDGFNLEAPIEALLDSDTDVGMAKTIGVATLGLADALDRIRPDLVLIIADRYEMLAPASVALALRIPIAHVEGGEVSEGAIDDAVRNALTKISHLHFVPNESARRRVLAMGEEPWRVHLTGTPSLDHLRRGDLPDRATLEARLGLDLAGGACVVSLHPVTLLADPTAEVGAVFEALEKIYLQKNRPEKMDDRCGGPVVFSFPNADAGHVPIIERARQFCARRANARLFVNLGHRDYWALLREAGLMIGNSSSGIMESPALELPCVNIGIRQRGRQRVANIIDADAEAESIVQAVARARSAEFRESIRGLENPYGDGHAAAAIAALLRTVEIGPRLLIKRPLPVTECDGGFAFTARDDRRAS